MMEAIGQTTNLDCRRRWDPEVYGDTGAHVEGTAVVLNLYIVADGVPVLADGKTPAKEEQIENKESRLAEFEKREYLALPSVVEALSWFILSG